MIKQIKNINNVGSYRQFSNGGSIQFEKLTFIYGLNTRGKSTLTDILTSLRDNDPTLITNRKSIPEISGNQNIKISFRPSGSTSQIDSIFSNNGWSQRSSSENLFIFSSEFIHQNLFTGISVERQNKENFTTFVLGQQGVQLATQIAEEKKLLRQKKGALPNLIPQYLRGKQKSEFHSFLSTDISTINIDEIKSQLIELESNLKQEQKRLEEPSVILGLSDIQCINASNLSINELIDDTNILLEREFSEISSLALTKLNEHIDSNFKTKDIAERWIKEGLDIQKHDTNNCTFCGQSLENAEDLINVFHSIFNQAYKDYISDILKQIEVLRKNWSTQSFNFLNNIVSQQALLVQYTQLINKDSFSELITQLEELISSTNENKLNSLLNQYSDVINDIFIKKERIPHEKIDALDFTELIDFHTKYISNLTRIDEIIRAIIVEINQFKEPYRDLSQITSKIADIESQIVIKKKIIARVEQNSDCDSYLRECNEIRSLEENIITNESTLSTNQSQYLNDFFAKIDFYFKQFGSENFTLERVTNNRGHQPVYFLKVKFKGVDVNDNNIAKVFSESDKRALALSLFWAKIDFLTDEQKSKAIIVLDDPITSFDDNRIMKSITRIKETITEVSQVVILTHYSHFIKNFIERGMNDDIAISYIEIAQDNTTSFLRRINDARKFTLTKYDEIFLKIHAFINRESEEDIRVYLRPFLESQYLPHFYIKQFKTFSEDGTPFGNLNEKINALFTDPSVNAKFHQFRTMLNPDSHLFTSSNEEDIRDFAREMMDYLYSFSHN